MFEGLSLWANLAFFVLAAIAVWIAGWRIARYADGIESRTAIGEGWIGMLLLGSISGLPELATTTTASFGGNAVLAVNNVVGSTAANLAIMGAADAAVKRETLSVSIATPTPLLQASLLVVMLGVIGAGILAGGDFLFLGVGPWSWTIAALYVLSLGWVRNTRGTKAWKPQRTPPSPRRQSREQEGDVLWRLVAKTAAGAAVIVAAGYALARSGQTIAEQTGLGQTFFGAVFLSFATSLSDISIVFSAVRLGRYEMAIGDLFGSALFTLALVFSIDLAYDGPPVLAAVGAPSLFAVLMGIVLAALFIAGAVERHGARIGRMGLDSLALLAAYAAGIYVLYRMR